MCVLFKIFAIVSILPFDIVHTVPLFIEKEAKVIPTSSSVILMESFIWKCVELL